MRKKTTASESVPDTIIVTKEELATMIREGIAAKQQNTVFNKCVKPYFVAVLNSRFTWFVIGFLICATLFPFVKGGTSIIQRISDSPQAIAMDAPNKTNSDQQKRRTISMTYYTVAERIKDKTITTQEEAFSALTTETANVLSVPAWKKTTDRLETFLKTANDLDSLGDKLYVISNCFE